MSSWKTSPSATVRYWLPFLVAALVPFGIAAFVPFSAAQAVTGSAGDEAVATYVPSVSGRLIDCGTSEAFSTRWTYGQDSGPETRVSTDQLLRTALREGGAPDHLVDTATIAVVAVSGDASIIVDPDGGLQRRRAARSAPTEGLVTTELALDEGVDLVVGWHTGPHGVRIESMSGCVDAVFDAG